MPYRSDEEAVRSRKEELERELADVKRRSAEFAYLEWRANELERELAELTKREAAFAKKRQLPMLANAKIASPCHADWDQMIGDDQVRFCKSCEKNVYNLSAMTSEAAEALIVEKEGNMCARFYRRSDGTILTADCPVGVRRKWVRRAGAAAVLFGTAAAGTTGLTISAHPTMGDIAQQPVVMGSVASTPEVETAPTTSATPDPTTPHTMGHIGRVVVKPADPKKDKGATKPKDKPHVTMGIMAAPGDPLASGL